MSDSKHIVSPQWLSEHLEDRDVVVVDCRFSLVDADLGSREYQESHIPGAHYLHLNQDLASPVDVHGGRHPLPDTAKLGEKLASIGVNFQKTLVVAYDNSKLAFASRLWWLLRYMGHDAVALLDGGWSTWVQAGYPVTAELSTPVKGEFLPQLRPEMQVDIEVVKARKDLPEVALVDSREVDRFLGKYEPIDPVAGHIPGAVNYYWQEAMDSSGKVRSPEEQRQRWQDIQSAEEIIVYCGSGVTACANLLSLELAGISGAKLYPGSWSDWCSYL